MLARGRQLLQGLRFFPERPAATALKVLSQMNGQLYMVDRSIIQKSIMKKSEKTKGKEKEAEKKKTYRKAGIAAGAAIIVIIAIVGVIFFGPLALSAGIGDKVSVYYTGTFENGTVFDSKTNGTPLTFTVGGGQMIKGFDAAVRGMKKGETKTVTIPYDQAYGAYDPELVQIIDRSKFPENTTFTPGERYYLANGVTGNMFEVSVINVTNSSVAIDANPQLAGQNLTFAIQMVDIKKGNSTTT